MENEFLIDISAPTLTFQNSLDLPGNSRIIFSAPFGSGKTFFLKRFFQNSEKYLALHLYPTNYSVSKTEDIFELVKYDILYELLKHKVKLAKMDVSFTEAIPFLDSEEQIKIISQFLSLVPKIGKPVIELLKELKELTKTIDDRKKKILINEGDKIKDFASSIEQTKGSIYEIDFYSNLIIDLIKRLKTERAKEIVLIIDDLDRIDPDHIFRLLNIFASHLDLEKNEENKFDLDKIIVCCDIENIRTLFHNKFGQDVDFSGYIDKFYSREVFEFNNKTLVSQSIDKILTSIKIGKEYDVVNYISNSQKLGFSFIKYFLISFINSNAVNLRVLLKLYNKDYKIRSYSCIVGRKEIRNWQTSIALVFDFLADLFGDTKALKRAILKTNFPLKSFDGLGIREDHVLILTGELLLLADFSNHNFIPTQSDKPPYEFSLNGKSYHYIVDIYDHRNEMYSSILSNESGQRLNSSNNLETKSIILKAYDSYLQLERRIDK